MARSLKRSIIVKNQFNVKRDGSGTHGNSPGDYVKRYAARSDATEDLAPVKPVHANMYATRYMAREDATEASFAKEENVLELKYRYRSAQKLGGRTFGPGNVSLSHDELLAKSNAAQDAFDGGATLLMTVLSFDADYLEEMGIVPEGFKCRKRGDYKGNVDQMKLRMAINEGMSDLSRRFDDLDWVGAVQVDTKHVHCHLLSWDRGVGRVRADGEQMGKLSSTDIACIRRGVDRALGGYAKVTQLSANVTDDKRNVRCFVKRFANDVMLENGAPQFLLACLPADRRLWRARTNRAEMRKPNMVCRAFVEEVLDRPDSGFERVRADIAAYANERAEKEGLSDADYRKLIDDGEANLVDSCINAVYDVLKRVPPDSMTTRTPLLDIMGMEYADAASLRSDDPIVEFGFRLRSYSSRIEHHRKEKRKWEDLVKVYQESEERAASAEPMLRFYQVEAEYNAMVMAKYQHFLAFVPPGEELDKRIVELEKYGRERDNLRMMLDDPSFNRFSDAGAEVYGREVYGHTGGRFLATGRRDLIESRLDAMNERYSARVTELKSRFADYARTFDEDYEDDEDGLPRLRLRMRREVAYPFDEVKALDMHHLAYDFAYDAAVSSVNVRSFSEMTRRRSEALDEAIEYLTATGQEDFIPSLPVADIQAASTLASSMVTGEGLLPSRRLAASNRRAARTIALTEAYAREMQEAVSRTVNSVAQGYE